MTQFAQTNNSGPNDAGGNCWEQQYTQVMKLIRSGHHAKNIFGEELILDPDYA